MTEIDSYGEDLLQWMWKNLQFDCSDLQTICGKSLRIVETGEWNKGAGPDFLAATVIIDGREWHGSVEIHKSPDEWYGHKHHEDKNYNSVVLHVVYESNRSKKVKTKDGHTPYTLCLKPYIQQNIHLLLRARSGSEIACSGNLSFINQEAFKKQVQSAHREYLGYKLTELLEFYDPTHSVSDAWKGCLITGIYKTLGIPSNEGQMICLAGDLLWPSPSQERQDFINIVKERAFSGETGIDWNTTGMRPASRPEIRVKQAAAIHYQVNEIDFRKFMTSHPDQSWYQIVEHLEGDFKPGKSRLNLIKQIVYIPALYLLGDLLHIKRLKQQAFEGWQTTTQFVPEKIKGPFRKAGFQLNTSTNILGLAHQYKRYCMRKNCHGCEVFKKAIHS